MNKPAAYTLAKPDPAHDAPFTYEWFSAAGGDETLALMGDKGDATPTLASEQAQLEDFVKLEEQNKQLTWMIHANDSVIGAVWISLEDTDYLQSPCVHIMIGDSKYRRRGIGMAVMKEMIKYAYCNLPSSTLYSRRLVRDIAAEKLTKKLGFEKDGDNYTDDDGLEWQNISLVL